MEGLAVEYLEEGEWDEFELDVWTPGFLSFVYAILSCQHLYLRINAAERGLVLASGEGHITLTASHDWDIETLRIHFDLVLRSGRPGDGDVDYIVSRMKACPVSRNIRECAVKDTSVCLCADDGT